MEKRDPEGVMFSYNLKAYPNINMKPLDFKMTVEEAFRRPVLRQAYEGLAISHSIRQRDRGAPIELPNSRKEFHQPGTIRPNFSRL